MDPIFIFQIYLLIFIYLFSHRSIHIANSLASRGGKRTLNMRRLRKEGKGKDNELKVF